jgi:uncharacterized protein (DUF697 family)
MKDITDIQTKVDKIPICDTLILTSVGLSLIYSLYLFFGNGDLLTAIFIGLWAPTLMGVVNYINLKFK